MTDAPRPVVLDARDVSINFGGVQALRDAAITVREGDIVAVIGPNGAGKTSLLNAICGLVPVAKGSVVLDGAPVLGLAPSRLAKLGLSRSFQDPKLLEKESALENVMSGAHLTLSYGVLHQLLRPGRSARIEADEKTRARGLLADVGLGPVADEEVQNLPYGVRKLVDIVRALMARPRLLVLDEPSSGLDGRERRTIERLLLDLKATSSISIVLVEHHMDLVRAVADEVVALRAGQVLTVGRPEQVLDSAEFRAAVLGRAL